MEPLADTAASDLQSIYARTDAELLRSISAIVAPHVDSITHTFYTNLLNRADARLYLDNQQVETRLSRSLSAWLVEVLSPADPVQAESRQKQQVRIGDVHSRIKIPMQLVDHAMQMVKREVFLRLIDSELDRKPLAEAIMLVNALLDASLSGMNESYLRHTLASERDAQNLRFSLTGTQLVVESEKMRAKLFDWERQLLATLYSHSGPGERLLGIHDSEFGLWVTHKAGLYYSDVAEVERLQEQLDVIEAATGALRTAFSSAPDRIKQTIGRLDEEVNETSWLLSSLNEIALAEQNSTDPLTRLLNRRFLEGVMQRETRLAATTARPYAVLMIDVDDFKPINDRYGHAVGDRVLSDLGEILQESIRVTDFAFRYGGEEFLVLINDVDAERAVHKAERLIQRINSHGFSLSSGETLPLSVSIGIGLFDGHPDYQRVIDAADQALYRAKQTGKNRCVLDDS